MVRIASSDDLGRYVRNLRKRRGLTQTDLAAAASVSRRWLADLEAGKPTVEVRLVFQILAALAVVLDARTDLRPDPVDLDEHLRQLGGQP